MMLKVASVTMKITEKGTCERMLKVAPVTMKITEKGTCERMLKVASVTMKITEKGTCERMLKVASVTMKITEKGTCERMLKVAPVTMKITEKRLECCGHLKRKGRSARATKIDVPIKRRRGMQKPCWKDSCKIYNFMENVGLKVDGVLDRTK